MAKHLYIMQSADGFLKIGQSKHPRVRRRSLQNTRGCAVVLLLRVANRGCDEQAVLRAMASFSAGGEWFHDTPDARLALKTLFGDVLTFRAEMPHWKKPTRHRADEALAMWRATNRQYEYERHPWKRWDRLLAGPAAQKPKS